MELWRKVNAGGRTKRLMENEGSSFSESELGSPSELQKAFEKMRNRLRKESKAVEAPKSLEEIEFIGMMQQAIAQERERLGLAPGYYIPLERVRLFHPDAWVSPEQRPDGASNSRGEYRPLEDWVEAQIVDPKDQSTSPYAQFKTLGHELIHQTAVFETDPIGIRTKHRVGYRDYVNGVGVGLDEGMTEAINLELLEQHSGVLSKRFHNENDGTYKWWSDFPTYNGYRAVIQNAINHTDKILYQGAPTTWDNLKRGHFAGDTKALEDVERALGHDVLRLLMALGNPKLFDLEKAAQKFNCTTKKAMSDIENDIRLLFISPKEAQVILDEIIPLLKSNQ